MRTVTPREFNRDPAAEALGIRQIDRGSRCTCRRCGETWRIRRRRDGRRSRGWWQCPNGCPKGAPRCGRGAQLAAVMTHEHDLAAPDESPVFAWARGFGSTEGANGVRLVDALALVVTAQIGGRVEDPSTRLFLDPVTAHDRLVAVGLVVSIAYHTDERYPMAERAQALVRTAPRGTCEICWMLGHRRRGRRYALGSLLSDEHSAIRERGVVLCNSCWVNFAVGGAGLGDWPKPRVD